MAETRCYGIRHHGPGSAKSLRRALESFQPDVVLIEGPADADSLVQYLPELTPPVALLAWSVGDAARYQAWPVATFSPEWQALSWANQHQVPVAFLDLPSSLSLAGDAQDGTDAAEEDNEIPVRRDALTLLSEAAGYDDPERWWEDLVEQREGDEVFDAVAEAMTAVREHEKPDQKTLIREAHMRKVLRAKSRSHQRVAVVCGAYHVPALSGKLPSASTDNALLRGLPKIATKMTWVPWAHTRLSVASGYGAGVRSPGWYHHLFTAADEPVARWLTHISGVLRDYGLATSSAHVIEGVRLAQSLAALRGRPAAGLSEVQDATLAVLCEGNELAWRFVTERAVVGEALGVVGDNVPRTPLDADLTNTIRKLRMKQGPEEHDLKLDLRKPLDLARSVLLRRLQVLGIDWGRFRGQQGTGTFREEWQISWQPEFAVAIIEAARWGNTVEQAAGAKLLHETETLAQVTSAIESALIADLPRTLPELLTLLDRRAAVETDIMHMLEALPPLARAHRYGDVRGTDTGRLAVVSEAVLQRACAGLPTALSGLAPESADQARGWINAADSAVGLLGDAAVTLWRDTLLACLDRHDLPGLISGRLVRMLFDSGQLTADEVSSKMSLALSGGHDPDDQAAWAEGLLTGSSLLLLYNPELLGIIDSWVLELSPEAFITALPVVRRALGSWSSAERQRLADQIHYYLDKQPLEVQGVRSQASDGIIASVNQILEAAR